MHPDNVFRRVGKLLARAKKAYKGRGIYHVIQHAAGEIYNTLYCEFLNFKTPKTFTFQGEAYRYFYHPYNTTWRNERAVEVPIALRKLQSCRSGRILEVGNVLSNYMRCEHDIVDKYEEADGVLNQDVVDFQPPEKYDLIVSISTLEHVGWDEEPREPKKILRALENLKTRCLAPGGQIVVTLPLGSNPEMDRLLKDGTIQFTKQFYLKRVSKDNEWIEVDWVDVSAAKYGNPFPCANGVVIGIIEDAN